MLEHGTKEKESGLLPTHKNFPTPTVADTFTDKLKSSQQKEGSMHSVNLSQAVHMTKMFPTPTTQETEHPLAELTKTGRRKTKNGKTSHSLNLADTVKMFPTPTAGLEKHSTKKEYWENRIKKGRQNDIQMQIYKEEGKGTLNSEWVEWLMGYPIGWTDIGLENQKESQELQQDKQTECKDSKDSETL